MISLSDVRTIEKVRYHAAICGMIQDENRERYTHACRGRVTTYMPWKGEVRRAGIGRGAAQDGTMFECARAMPLDLNFPFLHNTQYWKH